MVEQKSEWFERWTEFGHYFIVVTADKPTKSKYVKLYKVDTDLGKFWRWAGLDKEFIDEKKIGWYSEPESAIKTLIFEHEIIDAQLSKMAEADTYLNIDYEAEMKKRQPKPKQKEEEHQQQQRPKGFVMNDFTKPEPVYVAQNGREIPLSSISNLPQFRHLKELLKEIKK